MPVWRSTAVGLVLDQGRKWRMAGRGRKPKDPAIVAAVPGVYARLKSQRLTALELGVSNGLVYAVLRGKRKLTAGAPKLVITPQVEEHITQVYADTQSERITAERVGVSKTSVHYVLAGRPVADEELAPGERSVKATNCGQGHIVKVLPCRICKALAYAKVQRAIRARVSVPNVLAHPNVPSAG